MTQLPRNWDPFDLILMMGVLHHLDDTQAAATIALYKQVLKSEGSLLTIDAYCRSGGSFIAEFPLNRDRGRVHSKPIRLPAVSFKLIYHRGSARSPRSVLGALHRAHNGLSFPERLLKIVSLEARLRKRVPARRGSH